MFAETFSYDFIARFKACKPMMEEEQAEETESKKVWQNVYDLAPKYDDDPLLNAPEKLKALLRTRRAVFGLTKEC
jgi:hypothetical protein